MVQGARIRGFSPRELRRKVFHVLLGAFFIAVMDLLPDLMPIAIILLVAGTVLSMVHARRRLPVVGQILDRFDRPGDLLPGIGIITFFLGTLLSFLIFPKMVAIAGVAVMTFGDPMASIVGMSFGNHRYPLNSRKTIEGTLAFVLVSLAVLVPMVGPIWGAVGAIGGALVESVRIPSGWPINDNVTVPLGASLAIWCSALLI